MVGYTMDELRDALGPIASLLSKSEKAQQRVAPGTWQHTMLANNVHALRIASSLMKNAAYGADPIMEGDLLPALRACASMIERSTKAQPKFSPGTSQNTLLRNRIKALTIAETLIKAALDRATVQKLQF